MYSIYLNLQKNILSVSRLINEGVNIIFNDLEAILMKDNKKITCIRNKDNGMYYWTGWRIDPQVYQVNVTHVIDHRIQYFYVSTDQSITRHIRNRTMHIRMLSIGQTWTH